MPESVIEDTSVAPASNAQDNQAPAASANAAPDARNGAPAHAAPATHETTTHETANTGSDLKAEAASAPEPDVVAEEEESRQAIQSAHADASLEIDHRRAKQLLDRALLLSERGDLAGAILAARQAVVLTPTSPSGHSMLGLLHERAGELEKAIASYEKVLQIAPHSILERDSLERLKATLEQENSSVIFHFDDSELFEEPEALPVVPGADGTAPARPVMTQAATAAIATSAATAAAPPVSAPASPPVSAVPPIATPPLGTPLVTPAMQPTSVPTTFQPLDFDRPVERPPLVRALIKQPSFYFKGAPLMATTALGLIFMAWAQGVAQNRRLADLPRVAPPPLTVGPETGTPATAGNTETNTGATAPAGANPTAPPPGTATGGDIFGSGRAQQGQVGEPAAGGNRTARATGSGSRPAATGGNSGRTTAPLPPSAAPPIIPQPEGPGNSGSSGGSGSSTGGSPSPFAGLGPITPRSDSAPAVRPGGPAAPATSGSTSPAAPAAPAAPATNDGGNSRGGGLFNPGSQPRGITRIDPVRPSSATVPRPANVVRRAEAAAASAAASGNTGRAIGSMSESIERLPTGYAYQRRAMAFLEQRDFSRAADDFQSAIAAFEDQIRRGQDVEDARAGIRTCRSGLQMAIANIRR